jgi:hypothetical protein
MKCFYCVETLQNVIGLNLKRVELTGALDNTETILMGSIEGSVQPLAPLM